VIIMERLIYDEKSYRMLLPSYFRIYEDRVEAYFWPYKHMIPLSDIRGIETIEKIPWYVGWGLRISPFRKKLYFATHHGRSVEIERASAYWRRVVLSVKDPEKFTSTLRSTSYGDGASPICSNPVVEAGAVEEFGRSAHD